MIDIVEERDGVMMGGGGEKNGGMLKMENNDGGDSDFVDWRVVRGRVRKGFEYYEGLDNGFGKCVLMVFMIREVDGFSEGNGGIWRIMMNGEVVGGEEWKIIIGSVLREDYVNGVGRLRRRNDGSVVIRGIWGVRELRGNIEGDEFDGRGNYVEDWKGFKDGEG